MFSPLTHDFKAININKLQRLKGLNGEVFSLISVSDITVLIVGTSSIHHYRQAPHYAEIHPKRPHNLSITLNKDVQAGDN